jgi:inosose dehydratase
MITLGFSLYGMQTLGTFHALKVCAGAGYKGVELVATSGRATSPENLSAGKRSELRRILEKRRLALLGLMENLRLLADDATHRRNLDRLKAAAELGHALTAQTPVIETTLGGSPNEWDSVKEAMAERLRSWAAVAESAEAVVAVKPHVGSALHSPEGARWLVRQVASPCLKLAYDYSHFQLRGMDMAASMEAMIPDTRFIHVKDSAGDPANVQFLLPGDGNTDYVAYVDHLKRLGYSGPVVVEVSGQIHGKPGYDPIETARRCYANLRPVLEEAGIGRT